MTEYTLGHLLEECVDSAAAAPSNARGHTVSARYDIYNEAWVALNAWIESQLCKRKGAEVPLLGKFTWEFKQSDSKDIICRPIFMLSEQFAKTHHVRKQRIHKQPLVAPSEEVNFSRLSIKFSKKLTKDMVSAGVRDIVRKIGEFVDRVYEFRIDFTFGSLRSKERVVRFEFNMARMQQIMPENTSGLYIPDATKFLLDDEQSQSDASEPATLTSRSDLSTQQLPYVNIKDNPRMAAKTSLFANTYNNTTAPTTAKNTPGLGQTKVPLLPLHSAMTTTPNDTLLPSQAMNVTFQDTRNNSNDDNSYMISPSSSAPPFTLKMSPRTQELFLSLNEITTNAVNKSDVREKAKAKVTEQLYLKTLEDLDKMAKDSDVINTACDGNADELIQIEKTRILKAKEDAKKLRAALDVQFDKQKTKKLQEKEDMRNSVAAFFLQDDSTFAPPGSTLGATKAKVKEDLRYQLVNQINKNMERRMNEKRNALIEESEYLDHVAMELDLENIAERAAHLEKQKTLLESWERDGHIRNLMKIQEKGTAAVHAYLTKNLPDAMPNARAKSTMTVGFDTRKGK